MTTTVVDVQTNLGVTPGKRSWKRMTWWLAILLLLGSGGALLFTRWQASAAEPAVRYRTEEARIGNLTVTVTATGQLQPTRTVDVGSEVSGIIDSVLVNYNDYVKVGQVLAKINTEKLDAQVLQDRASLETARAKVEDAKVTVTETEAEYNRIVAAREKSKGQLPSQHDLDTAKAAYGRAKVAVTSAQAAVTQAEASLAVNLTNVSKAVIKSPVDGIVLARNVEPGQTIAASFSVTTMFQLAEDLTRMKLQVNIDEADIGEVKEGQNVTFTVDAYPGRTFPGKITQLRYQSTTTNNVVTYLAVISVDNRQMLLRPGMTATATITVQSLTNALLAPNVALRFTPASAGAGGQGDQRSFFRKLMPGPPPMPAKTAQTGDDANAGPRVWVLKGLQPVPVPVKTGVTNGKVTEIRSGAIAPGVPLVVEALKGGK
ncbi:efflux RND transporter periplasmic adaptor subunit [uncultured Paludibaculum sp.]|uniref:efflux RND transporter periplasmic adaptor subunit n=1 Tax=uncultured Paludibaculum sp. TaxID=1765020 RepID=UPI002AABDF99|nr:efflux RND transporter periplasmic adaptor subunit [uncultured Paludibaculum sp.]